LSGSGDGTREFGLPIDGIFAINAKYSYWYFENDNSLMYISNPT
jgi:hypothetical protein